MNYLPMKINNLETPSILETFQKAKFWIETEIW